ncbi:hypothetical protein B0T14DRAFT_595618 [Immersiella caudata]|uniref:Siderophore iron transporter n=1 Tax=Immersiella caudata TaxID=314043 RepID=A0AA39U483_9PEZI|nr:hypothetical protein B0T14DRAFT_595618 [Immersiella caudata]
MRFRSPLDRFRFADEPVAEDEAANEKKSSDKEANVGVAPTPGDGASTNSDEIDTTAQAGVQRIEAFTKVWTRRDLILANVSIWFIYFMDAMQSSMSNSLVAYVTSDFRLHGITATTSIMSGLIAGLSKLPLAKVLDIWSRPQGFNVETYATAQVFYWVGISIFIADTTHLKNRGFMLAFAASPYIITTWIGGPLAKAFLDGPRWRWGYGAFSITTPVICMLLLYLFYVNARRAEKAGLLPKREQSNRTAWQSVKYYARSPLILGFLVTGFVLLILFVVWEKYFAPKTFIPYSLLKDCTVLGDCILAGTLFISFYIWDSYFFSFLQTVVYLEITPASYVMNIYSIGSCFWSIIVGLVIRYNGRFKPVALYFSIPLTILGISLMLRFRTKGIAAMAATTHQYIAVVLAVESMFASVGGAVGSTVAAAIWNGIFPQRLMEYLPAETKGNFTETHGSLVVQRSFPMGTPTKSAINSAYSEAQKWMLIASTAIQAVSIASGFKQVKGLVV